MDKITVNQCMFPDVTAMGNDDNKSKVSAEELSSDMAEANEDSSYDSDFETDETCTTDKTRVSRTSSAGLSSHHDVSRTTSDTLGAEFAEYVTEGQTEEEAKKTQKYTARLEFGLKLGYTEALIQTALKRLKPEPSNNELLAELIKLGAAAPKPFNDELLLDHQIPTCQLRHIVVDGSNVAMSHGNSRVFSCKGIKLCVDWFKSRGHKEITVFVPKWRKETPCVENAIRDQEILNELEKERLLVYTPSRLVGGRRYICYDDRYILKLAAQVDGVVVSNDNFRDLAFENADFGKVVEERILMYSFVNDRFMPPDDPMGRSGPNLDTFLTTRISICPYGIKCTYGYKCRYNHPERKHFQKPVAELLTEQLQKQNASKANSLEPTSKRDLKTKSLPLSYENHGAIPKKIPLSRTRSAAPAPTPTPPPHDPVMKASMVSNFNRAQMEYQQQRAPPDYHYTGMSHSTMELPSKSHSIDNLSSSFQDMKLMSHASSQNLNYSQQNIWANPDMGEQGSWTIQQGYRGNQEQSEMVNMHRKLHRQLTLNPNYDPRLYRMHGGGNNINQPANTSQDTSVWPNHQTVARMASDPTAGPSWVSSTWPSPPPGSLSRSEVRSRTRYLLSGIFPEEKVHKAMALLPDETDPQKICAFIISHT